MKCMTYGENLQERMENGEFDEDHEETLLKCYPNLGELDEKQCRAVEAFRKEHCLSCKTLWNCNDFGGDISIIVSSDGIGQCIHVMCNKCGAIEDITNVENW